MKDLLLGVLFMLSLALGGATKHLHDEAGKTKATVKEYVILVTNDGLKFGQAEPGLDIEATIHQLGEFIKNQANEELKKKAGEAALKATANAN